MTDRVRAAVCAVALTLANTAAAGDDREIVRFTSREEGERVVIRAENTHPDMPYHVEVEFPVYENLSPSEYLPARFVIPPDTQMDLMWLDRIDANREVRMQATYLVGKGDPGIVPDANYDYLFPFAHGRKFLVSQGYFGAYTHQGAHALDFQLPEGTPICAARGGIVVGTKNDSGVGGAEARYLKHSNYVNILHADGTWANYAHIKRGGVKVRPGQKVKAGDVIALSGSTGQANGPHLHFAVYRAAWGARAGGTIPTLFTGVDGEIGRAEEGRFYYAVHPGGESFDIVLAERMTDESLESHSARVALNGQISVRPVEIDHKVFIYCVNGKKEDQHVTIDFVRLTNLKASREFPYTRRVPAGREVHMLSLTRQFTTGQIEWNSAYGIRYSWEPAAGP